MSDPVTVPITLSLGSLQDPPISIDFSNPGGNITTASFTVGIQSYDSNSNPSVYDITSIKAGQWVYKYSGWYKTTWLIITAT